MDVRESTMALSLRAAFAASALMLALASGLFAQGVVAPGPTAATQRQAQTLPAVPPHLSYPQGRYFQSHPAEWQQFLSQLPRRPAAPPPRARLPSAPWQSLTHTYP